MSLFLLFAHPTEGVVGVIGSTRWARRDDEQQRPLGKCMTSCHNGRTGVPRPAPCSKASVHWAIRGRHINGGRKEHGPMAPPPGATRPQKKK